MCKSDSRREGLQETIDHGNHYGVFVNELGETIEVPALQPLRDSETRWSSTYNMIRQLIQLYPDICSILSVLNNAQELLSAERTPTLSLALPVYETLIHTLADLRATFPELSCAITRGIEKLELYVNKTRYIPVYALAMVVNPCFKFEWIDNEWESLAREQAYTTVRDQMLRYRKTQPNITAPNV
ncbi:hypothetical protein FRC10_010696 [Ceratobasidium sp. 414]|nr:hypothetical protein FRC10_010696 [Ceratobasidium sp. 414]